MLLLVTEVKIKIKSYEITYYSLDTFDHFQQKTATAF